MILHESFDGMLVTGVCCMGGPGMFEGANRPTNASCARGSVDGESCFVVVALGVIVVSCLESLLWPDVPPGR